MLKKSHYESIWDITKRELAKVYSPDILDLIFGEVRITEFDDETVTLTTDSGFKYHMMTTKYKEELEKAFERGMGFPLRVTFRFDGNPTDIEKLQKQILGGSSVSSNSNPPDFLFKNGSASKDKSSGITSFEEDDLLPFKQSDNRPLTKGDFLPKQQGSVFPASTYEYTFENFIVGSSNKFAHAACTAVADHPATNFNPLFIYGQSGLGKTHLMYAVINRIRNRQPGVNIQYIKGEEFTNQLIDSISRSAMPEFRNKFRNCDVLLIDDIQFVAGKTSTQEEFFHTFNALYEDHKQIILTSDRPPRDIKTLEDRLKTRFEWGLLADVQPPDLELRIAILKKKCESMNLSLSDDILMFLAENLRSNIRQLEGVIKKLSALTFVTGDSITMQEAQSCITEFMGSEEPVGVTVDRIFAAVEKKFGVSKEDIIGSRRTKDIATARHVAVFLIRQVTDMSLPNIGKLFNRDHTTVLSSCETVEKRMLSDPPYNLQVNELLKSMKNNDR